MKKFILTNLIVICLFGTGLGQKPDTTASKMSEWDILNNKTGEYYKAGDYANALIFAQKALEQAEKDYGKKNEKYLSSLNDLGRLNYRTGQFEKAEEYNLKCLQIRKKVSGEKHSDYAGSCLNLANVYKDMGEYEKSEEYYQIALKIFKITLGEKHSLYGTVINNLGLLYINKGNYPKAEEYLLNALQIRKEVIGEKHIDYAGTLNNLGVLYVNISQYDKSEEYYLKSAEIKKQVLGEMHPMYAASLNNLGALYKYTGDYKKAEEYSLKSLQIQKVVLGEKHPEYARSLSNIGVLYLETGDFEKAEEYILKSMQIRKEVLGERHPEYSASLNNLGIMYSILGNYESAEKLYLESLKIKKEKHGEKHPEIASILSNLGILYYNMGIFEKSEEFYLKSIRIYKEVVGEKHQDYANSLNNLGMLYFHLGNYEKAEEFYIKSMKLYKDLLGEKHPSYLSSLNNLGAIYFQTDNYDKAEEYFLKVLKIRKEVLGENNTEYAASLNNLGSLYSSLGNIQKAEEYFLKSLQIKKEIFGENHSDYASSLINLGGLYSDLKNYEKAEEYFLKSLEIYSDQLGINHPDYGLAADNLASMYENTGDYKKAEKFRMDFNTNLNNQIKNNFRFLSEKEKEKFVASIDNDLQKINSFIFVSKQQNQEICRISYNNELSHKGMILNSSSSFKKTVSQSKDTTVQKTYTKLLSVKHTLEQMYSKPIHEREFSTDSLEKQSELFEKELFSKIKGFEDFNNIGKTSWTDIQKALKPNEAAIEFTNFKFSGKDTIINGISFKNSDILYCAVVLSPKQTSPEMVYLFKEKQIDSLLKHQAGENDYKYVKRLYSPGSHVSTDIYKSVWFPFDSLLSNISTVYISVSGILNKIAFDAVPYSENVLLSDKYKIIYLSTTAKLLENNELYSKDLISYGLFGGLNYDTEPGKLQTMASLYSTEDAIASRSANHLSDTLFNRGTAWSYLPGTETEIKEINALTFKNSVKTESYTFDKGTEEIFKSFSGSSPSVIHLATHGFYFPEETRTEKSQFFGEDNQFINSGNPLYRSGLLLSGGGNIWDGIKLPKSLEDGVLSAYEISNLNLKQTKLVVLSACQTGLGDVKGSEGVFGLLRGFKMSGVDYIVMSLWEVPDAATTELMLKFYENIYSGKEIKAAFKASQDYMKNKYKDIAGSSYAWAAFVLVN